MFFVIYVLDEQNICNFEEVRNCSFPTKLTGES